MHFVFCPKQGNKIEGVVLNGVRILGIFCPKKGQGFKPSAAHLYPNIGRVLPTKGGGGGRRATEETVKLKMIRAVVKLWTQFMQLRKKPEKNSGLQRDLNPWALDTDAKL